MADPIETPDWSDEIDRRLDGRREEDRARTRTTFALASALIAAITILVSVGVAWGTSTSRLDEKVDKVEQIKIDAGFDARINVNAMRIDGIEQSLIRLQITADSINGRLTQFACDGKPVSCR